MDGLLSRGSEAAVGSADGRANDARPAVPSVFRTNRPDLEHRTVPFRHKDPGNTNNYTAVPHYSKHTPRGLAYAM